MYETQLVLDIAPPLLQLFGEGFLRWILNRDDSEPLAAQNEVAPEVKVLAELAQQGSLLWYSPQGRQMVLRALWQPQSSGRPLVLETRRRAGGRIDPPRVADKLASSLTELAQWAFPLQLLPAEPGEVFGSLIDLTTVLETCPSLMSFKTELKDDPATSRLYPVASERQPLDTVGSNLIWSSGGFGSSQLGLVPYSALSYLFALMHIEGPFTFEAVSQFAAQTVGTMREIGQNGTARVPAVATLSHLLMGDDVRISAADWSLSSLAQSTKRLPGSNQHTTGVLTTSYDLKLLDVFRFGVGEPDGDTPFEESPFGKAVVRARPEVIAADDSISSALLRGQLALALASPEDAFFTPFVQSRAVLNPFVQATAGWPMDGPIQTVSRATLTPLDGDRVRSMAALTANLPPSLALGARRIVGAVSLRGEALDAFVDAVVCWENLFGTESEVSFRVCASLAKLLEPADAEARETLFKELKNLYNARSRLLHGAKEPAVGDANRHRERSIRVALSALRRVLEDPELRAITDSSTRSQCVLLVR